MIDRLWGVAMFSITFAAFSAALTLFNPVLLMVCLFFCNANKFRRR